MTWRAGLQASWDVYVHEMGYDFHQWDMRRSRPAASPAAERPTAAATTEVAVGVVLGGGVGRHAG